MLIPNLISVEGDVSSPDESYDSDQIDSDVEAELYSSIHHELVAKEPEENPDFKHDSLSFISVEENSNVKEKESVLSDLASSSNPNVNFSNSFSNKRHCSNNLMVENTGLKRKSNLIANILDNIQMSKELPRKKQKKANINKPNPPVSSSLNFTIEINDSDSDSDSSVILSEPDETNVQRLQTNMQIVCVSSDSESSTYLEESLNLHNNSFNGNYKDVWRINDTDLFRTKKKSTGRYHENAVSSCTNCNKMGHAVKYCTEPKVQKCFICGEIHMYSYCMQRICVKCLRYGHDSRRCYFPVDNIICSICNMRGHGKKCCPDLWRRYHLTTSGENIVKGRIKNQNTPIYCFNCGLEGHFGFQCDKIRMHRSYPTWSSVISYEHPAISLECFQRNMNVERDVQELQQPMPPNPRMLARLEKKKILKIKRNRQRRMKKKIMKSQSCNVPCEQDSGANSSFSNSSKNRNFRANQEINFPRTPKVSEPECIDEMPKMKQTRRGPRKSGRKKKEQLQRNKKKALQNFS